MTKYAMAAQNIHCIESAADRTRDIRGENPKDRSSTTGLSGLHSTRQQYALTTTLRFG